MAGGVQALCIARSSAIIVLTIVNGKQRSIYFAYMQDKWIFVFHYHEEGFLSLLSTHWGWVMHVCISKLTIIGSDNGLLPCWRQAIIWTNAGIMLIGPLGTNFSEMLIEIHKFSFKKMHLEMLSGKWCPFCLGLDVLMPSQSSEIIQNANMFWGFLNSIFHIYISWDYGLNFNDSLSFV